MEVALRIVLAFVLLVAACKKDGDSAEDVHVYDGPIDMGPAIPWPNHQLVVDGQLAIPSDVAGPGVPVPDPSRLTWRTGLSPSQTSVVRLPGIDDSGFPSFDAPTPGEGTVRMLDLTDGTWLPAMAELDAYPEAELRALLVRPLQALPFGHRIGVVVTTEAMERPEAFDALVEDEAPGNEALVDHTRDLVAAFESAGLATSEIALAWDFPVDDPRRPLQSALGQLEVSGSYEFQLTRDADDGDVVPATTWRTASGWFEVTDFLVDDRALDMQADGSVRPTGTDRSHVYVHVPQSVRDAPEGSVPVMIFGHGIFSTPELYLDERDDPSGLIKMAEEGGFIVVATNWRGLTTPDTVEVVAAATDFTGFPVVPERLVQGQVNTRTLAEMVVRGDFFDDPLFVGDSGQKLPMSGRSVYYGISLGGIQGAILLANDAPLDATALHVGGAFWSTMLERSSNWNTFETLMISSVPEAADRQLLYSISQLWWDFADPASFVPDLVDRPLLYQYAIGDEQVPNMTTEALARSIGLPLLTPEHHTVFGLQGTGPLGPGSRALVQFDPEKGFPDPTNRPAEVTEAHYGPRKWDGARRQVIEHLELGSEGQVVHHCGATVCSESNQGE